MAVDVDAEHRAFVASLPPMRLTPQQFMDLLEYSSSNPTGTTNGKMWRRLDGVFDHAWRARGGKPRWIICQYDPNCPDDAKTIAIHRYRPIIVLRARTAWGYEG